MKTLSDKMNFDWYEKEDAYIITNENSKETHLGLILDHFNIDTSEICDYDLEGCSIMIEDIIENFKKYPHKKQTVSVWFD